MLIKSIAIVNGIIQDVYGKRGEHFRDHDVPTYSIPFEIIDAPKDTKSFAIVLEDKDAIPVCGFSWIHWSAANITRTLINENEIITANDFIQGVNSWVSMQGGEQSIDACSCYGGLCPPDQPHEYELHVYALDTLLALENGYYVNTLYHKMRGHILEEGILYGTYSHENKED